MQKIDYLQEKVNNILNELNAVLTELNYLKNRKIEECETVYDKNSDDEKLNWNLTNGIMGAKSKTGLDFSKYKALRMHIMFGNEITHIAELSLVNPTTSSTRTEYYSSLKLGDETASSNFYYGLFKVVNKNAFYNVGMGFFSGSTKTARNNNINYCIYKIEGIF